MKVMVDGREFVRGRATGIGRFLSDGLCELAVMKRDWQFVLILNQHSEFVPDFPNLKKLRFTEVFTTFADQVQIPWFIRGEKADVFLSPYYKTPLLSGVPAVVTICDLINLIYPGYARSSAFYRQLFGIYAAKASAILTISDNSKVDIMRLLGVPEEKLSVIYPGVDPGVFYRKRQTAVFRSKYGLDVPYLLYMGNGNPHKNVNGLIAAYNLLSPEFKGRYRLVLCGVGDSEIALEQFSSGSCVRIGYVPDADMAELYSGAELLVFPSFYEGFGLPPLEAMACGCPVVSSRASCMPEVLADACLYFDPDNILDIRDKMQHVLSDASLRAELIRKGYDRAAGYKPERTAAEIVRVIERV
ncbi:MAG: hypothetical protein A2049_03285 [Elusimicrobia bacterium GWA2_62_23]|nr:MAG: hypothetical protein A2049_03285 [Elusimicrobia bacterium GWA2_62_23]HBB65904.1 hypothetical protein [Elusimicrobiota bacterium]